MKTPGQSTSEYEKTLRAEVYGAALLVFGAVLALATRHAEAGAAFAAVGGYVIAHTTSHYAAGRSAIKAAAVRRPADLAPPHKSI